MSGAVLREPLLCPGCSAQGPSAGHAVASGNGRGGFVYPPSPPQFQVYLSKLIERVVPTQGDALQGIWLLILEMLISHLGQMVTC